MLKYLHIFCMQRYFLFRYFVMSMSLIIFSYFFVIFTLFNLYSFLPCVFLNSNVSLCLNFHLLQPFLFYLNFHINFLLLLSTSLPYSFQVVHDKKVNALSLFLQFVSFGGFFIVSTIFFTTNGFFCYSWFNFQITFRCIGFYAYLGILVFQFLITSSFSSSHWFDLI